jgi:hypothetical protein
MNPLREQCLVLRKRGHTLSEIMALTGGSKSTVYGYIREIPLDAARLRATRVAAGKRIREFALARKGKSVRGFTALKAWRRETVSLVAHLMFDGGIYPHRGCVYSNRSVALLEQVERAMKAVYTFPPVLHQDPVTGVRRISYHNVALAGYLDGKAAELVDRIRELPSDCKRAFVQSFFDDEGCIDYRPHENRRSVRGYQKDVDLLTLIQELLREFDISARIIKPNEIMIVGKQNLLQFKKEINFSPGVYINEHRTNSRWKKNLEKRQILGIAIKSFKT